MTTTMNILFLGGTAMLGPHIITRLLDGPHARGNNAPNITIFHRGRRTYDYGDRVRFVPGDRSDFAHGLDGLRERIDAGERWDVVIDTASVNTWVDRSTELLRNAADRYLYVSSLSVYANNSRVGEDESAPVATMPDDVAATIVNLPYDMQYYGAVKARCEQAVAERHFVDRHLIFRPGLLIGPRDATHRFTWWPWRVREGGEILAPGSPDDPVQFIDVRDFADYIVHAVYAGLVGTYNVDGPIGGIGGSSGHAARGASAVIPDTLPGSALRQGVTMGEMLEACRVAVGPPDVRFTWADATWLNEHEVHMWSHMPVWIPPGPETSGFHTRDLSRAVATGLRTRPLAESIRDTLHWFDEEFLPHHRRQVQEQEEEQRRSQRESDSTNRGTSSGEGQPPRPADGRPGSAGEEDWFFGPPRPGLSRARERDLLRAWGTRNS